MAGSPERHKDFQAKGTLPCPGHGTPAKQRLQVDDEVVHLAPAARQQRPAPRAFPRVGLEVAGFRVMVRWPHRTRSAAPGGSTTAATIASSPAANFFASMPSSLLPRPRASSGSSASGKHSSRPASLTAATSPRRRPAPGTGAAPAPAAGLQHVLAAAVARGQLGERRDEAVAVRGGQQPAILAGADQVPAKVAPSGGLSRPDSGSPWPRADGRPCAGRL
jgi:hypothetical protein